MHVLIVGMTGSGKTTLAKRLVTQYKANKTPSLVLDPLFDPGWGADWQTANQQEFLDTMFQCRKCALFVDESGAAIGRYAGEMAVIATQSRHFGHKAHFLTQRGSQLDKLIRDQCSTLFLFRVSKGDAKTFADEFGYEDILQANSLAPGECFKVTRFSPPKKISIFN
jgi:DNA helicase HerA-like ATPase